MARGDASRCPEALPTRWNFYGRDSRLGMNFQTVSTEFQKVFKMHDKLFVGLPGLATDVQSL